MSSENSPLVGYSGGKPVTEADLDRMAQEFEDGAYDGKGRVTYRRAPGRPPIGDAPRLKSVVVRFSTEEVEELDRLAELEGTTRSGILRSRLGMTA